MATSDLLHSSQVVKAFAAYAAEYGHEFVPSEQSFVRTNIEHTSTYIEDFTRSQQARAQQDSE